MYNTAVEYLQKKYPSPYQRYTPSFESKLTKARNMKEFKAIKASATEDDIIRFTTNLKEIEGVDRDDLEIYLLLEQYSYGIEPKRELEAKLIQMNLVDSN